MATYKIDSSLLTAQANEIRTLNGTTATMNPSQMTTALQSANAEVAEQEQKIIEITEMLQGKAMGGGSGTSVETCTVTITGAEWLALYGFTRFVDAQLQSVYSADSTATSGSFVMENVVCNSIVIVRPNYHYVIPASNVNGTAELLDCNYSSIYFFKAPSVAGESCTINIYDDD